MVKMIIIEFIYSFSPREDKPGKTGHVKQTIKNSFYI